MRGATGRREIRQARRAISIHAPHAGCDVWNEWFRDENLQFQSTHPMRGATCSSLASERPWRYFNPRTPCGVRLDKWAVPVKVFAISIHAPHAGCDNNK